VRTRSGEPGAIVSLAKDGARQRVCRRGQVCGQRAVRGRRIRRQSADACAAAVGSRASVQRGRRRARAWARRTGCGGGEDIKVVDRQCDAFVALLPLVQSRQGARVYLRGTRGGVPAAAQTPALVCRQEP